MAAFKVCHFWLVASFYEGFEACFDERGQAAAENCLFPKEVSLGLFFEGGFNNTNAGAADTIGQESAICSALPVAS